MAASRTTRLANFAAAVTAATVRVGILARPPARATTATVAAMSRNGTITLSRRAMTTAAPPPNGPNPANAKRFQWIRDLLDDLFTVPTPKEYFERGWRYALLTMPFFMAGALTAMIRDNPSEKSFKHVLSVSFLTGMGGALFVLLGHGLVIPVLTVALVATTIHTVASTIRNRIK